MDHVWTPKKKKSNSDSMLVSKDHPQTMEPEPLYSARCLFFFYRKYAAYAPRYCASARVSPGCRCLSTLEEP